MKREQENRDNPISPWVFGRERPGRRGSHRSRGRHVRRRPSAPASRSRPGAASGGGARPESRKEKWCAREEEETHAACSSRVPVVLRPAERCAPPFIPAPPISPPFSAQISTEPRKRKEFWPRRKEKRKKKKKGKRKKEGKEGEKGKMRKKKRKFRKFPRSRVYGKIR